MVGFVDPRFEGVGALLRVGFYHNDIQVFFRCRKSHTIWTAILGMQTRATRD